MITVFAPAKINLYLHVTARRDDGYHDIDSLAAFADIGDKITIQPAPECRLSVQGPFARGFTAAERAAGPESKNLAVRAAHELGRLLNRRPDVHIMLAKSLPLASGIGGGSADAAATIHGLLDLWQVPAPAVPELENMMHNLGADVPACFACRPVQITGRSTVINNIFTLPEMPVVLVNPGQPCPTAPVFARLTPPFTPEPENIPAVFETPDDLIDWLADRRNMLTSAAEHIAPAIAEARAALTAQPGCRLARMSGSGATCFGLFGDEESAALAAETLTFGHPGWWVRRGTLNRPQRY